MTVEVVKSTVQFRSIRLECRSGSSIRFWSRSNTFNFWLHIVVNEVLVKYRYKSILDAGIEYDYEKEHKSHKLLIYM